MRKLMWFTLGYGTVCAVCVYAWSVSGLLLPAVVFACLFVCLRIAGKWFKALRISAAVCLGCAAGLVWFGFFSSVYLSRVTEVDGQICDVTARCTDYGYPTGYGTAVEGVLYLDGRPYRAKFYVVGEIDMEPGDLLKGSFKLRITTPDGGIDSKSQQSKGIFLLGYQEENTEFVKTAEKSGWSFAPRLRNTLLDLIDSLFPVDTAFFARALLLGDRSGIPYEVNAAFKVSGISHIIAVSGLHVSILFALVNLLCFKQRWLVAIVGIPVLVLFAAISGFSPSVVRACVMQGLTVLAMLFDKEYDGLTGLSVACLLMLFCNPLVITSAAFQMSVACNVGIILFYRPIYDWICGRWNIQRKDRFGFLKRWIAQSASVTVSATVLTVPLVAYYFHVVSLVSVVTNLLTLWVVGYIFYGIMLCCLLGWFWASAGVVIAGLVSWLIRYVLLVTKTIGSFPLAAVYTRSVYCGVWLVFCYVLLTAFLLERKKQPGLLLCCGALGLCIALGASWLEPMTDGCRMTVLDVGQGQSILLQSEGKTYLVDCGGDDEKLAADLAAETLLSQGISRLDGLILTHFDRDHAGGMAYLLSRIDADMVFVPDYQSGYIDQLEDIAAGRIVYVDQDLAICYGSTKITIFAPIVQDSNNERSLALLFQWENCDILITGDRSSFGERVLMKTQAIPELDILVAGHHGSKHSTSQELLEATKPKNVVISVGEDNPYGHPAPELLERLAQHGCAVYRTDIHGNIIFRR